MTANSDQGCNEVPQTDSSRALQYSTTMSNRETIAVSAERGEWGGVRGRNATP